MITCNPSGELAKLVSYTGKAVGGELVAFTVHERLASKDYCEKLSKARDEVYDLLVEQLRFQDWKVSE